MIRKKFQEIKAPILGEVISILGTPESLDKKTIKLDLTRKMKGKNLEIVLEILKRKNLMAYPKKLSLMKFYIRRMIRKNASYVEDSFKLECSDIRAVIKPFLITRKKVSRAIRNNLRKTTREFLVEYAKDKSYLEICASLLNGELQKEMLPRLKKIYPLSFCEIRVFETKELEKAVEKFEKQKNSEVQEEK